MFSKAWFPYHYLISLWKFRAHSTGNSWIYCYSNHKANYKNHRWYLYLTLTCSQSVIYAVKGKYIQLSHSQAGSWKGGEIIHHTCPSTPIVVSPFISLLSALPFFPHWISGHLPTIQSISFCVLNSHISQYYSWATHRKIKVSLWRHCLSTSVHTMRGHTLRGTVWRKWTNVNIHKSLISIYIVMSKVILHDVQAHITNIQKWSVYSKTMYILFQNTIFCKLFGFIFLNHELTRWIYSRSKSSDRLKWISNLDYKIVCKPP